MLRRIALLGGIYANYLALEAALDDARARGAEASFSSTPRRAISAGVAR